jgi:predicted O-methyltransferase YrrM
MIETYISLIEAYALETAVRGRRQVLEVGSAFGFSTILMAQAGAQVLAVDPHTGYKSWDAFLHNLNRYGVAGRVQAVRRPSQTTLPGLPAGAFELAFVDGDHSEEVASFDLQQARRLVAAGGIIAVHDYTERWPGVKKAVDRELRGLAAWRIQTLYLAVQ